MEKRNRRFTALSILKLLQSEQITQEWIKGVSGNSDKPWFDISPVCVLCKSGAVVKTPVDIWYGDHDLFQYGCSFCGSSSDVVMEYNAVLTTPFVFLCGSCLEKKQAACK